MAQTHFSATPMGLTTVAALEIAKNCVGSQGICDSDSGCFYRSSITQRQYQVSTGQTFQKGFNKADACYALTQIKANAGWHVDLLTLFDGAYNCIANGKAGGPVINVNADYTLDFSCLSSLHDASSQGYTLSCGEFAKWEMSFWYSFCENIRYYSQYSLH
jgi:hypothetical protein